MPLRDTLVKIIDLHGVLIDSIKVGDVSGSEASIEALKKYTKSTYSPANQLAKAILKTDVGLEGIGRTREVYLYLLEKHDKLRQVIQTMAELTDEVPYPRLSEELLEAYNQLHAVVSEIKRLGNRGDCMVVDVVLTSLGMAETQEEE